MFYNKTHRLIQMEAKQTSLRALTGVGSEARQPEFESLLCVLEQVTCLWALVSSSPKWWILRPECAQIVQFSSVAQSCPTLCNPMNCSTPGFPVHHQPPELAQTHVHWVSDAIQPSHPLSSSSPPAFNLSQHQGLFQWVSSWHQVAKVLELQLQYQPFQWTFRTDFL